MLSSEANQNKDFSIIFTHNINGETHPCGCRQFPLGGLPQVAGVLNQLKQDKNILLIDTGDTYFLNPVVPKTLEKSLSYNAAHLSEGLKILGVDLFVPGDQDFAMGADFLFDLVEKQKVTMLVANFNYKNHTSIKRWIRINQGVHHLYITGLLKPDLYTRTNIEITPPEIELQNVLNEMKKDNYDEKNSFHRLIVLTHAGIDFDRELAQKFPQIDWIIGSHSQTFSQSAIVEGKTQIVQVLSKNHYLGEISLNKNQSKESDSYHIHAVSDGLENKLPNNPLIKFIDDHKIEYNRLQNAEQTPPSTHVEAKNINSCVSCHQKQTEFWQGTPHSLAYLSLVQKNEKNNIACLKCHTTGEQNNLLNLDPVKTENYWSKAVVHLGDKSLRKQSTTELKKINHELNKLNNEFNVKSNSAHVQCINCHTKSESHPMELPNEIEKKNTRAKCLSCHTQDLAPEWYKNKKLDEILFKQKIKSITCPKM